MPSFLIDLILLILIVATVIRCTTRGFVKSVVHLISMVVALIVAYIFTPGVAAWLEETFFTDAITAQVADTIRSVAIRTGETFDFSRLFADMPTDFVRLLERFEADPETLASTFGRMSEAGTEAADRMAYAIAEPVVHGLASICAAIALFIGAMIACAILGWLLGLIFSLPVLRTADRFLGFLLGLISAFLLAWSFALAAEQVIGYLCTIDPTAVDPDAIDKTMIARHFCAFKLP